MNISGFITGSNGEKSKALGLLVVHHNDRKLILLASLCQLFFTIYTIVTVSFTDFYEITSCFQDLALPPGSFNNILSRLHQHLQKAFSNSINSLINGLYFLVTYDFISIYSFIFSPSKVQKIE
jgi:hypothetical protein